MCHLYFDIQTIISQTAERLAKFFFGARMHTRSSDENSVCPSVRPYVCLCLSVKRVNYNKIEEKSVQIFMLRKKSFILAF